uniref:AAA+ ATPase domain-containing protein n=1 Tax=Aureoumbra lagunensis TaxID=44058 RepID=A0A7S3NP87_9STRA|mmetsp:Transcript_14404/g.21745  ORF Transcript_14404/g.21745 Transcript_14404/m.21745 type:complete len:703 (+) Transcript_14404:77-2185(+)
MLLRNQIFRRQVNPLLHSQRGITGWFRNIALKRLERTADAEPNNASAQLSFLRALGRDYPDAALARIETIRTGRTLKEPGFVEEVQREYLKAFVASGRLENAGAVTQIREALRTLQNDGTETDRDAIQENVPPITSGITSQTVFPPPVYTTGNKPLEVSVVAASWWTQLWRTLRVVLIAFLALSALGAIMDDRGLSSRLGANTAIHTAESSDKRFDDVVGVDEAKSELEELVMYLKDPERFTRLGGKLPKGCLLTGPPGTGKTLLARAVAGEAGVPFFYASGSEFEEMYVGVGARRVRDLFEAAKKRAPCIVFIDEIDAVGGSRHLKEQQAMKMTLNQLLVEMDGFEQTAGVIVLGATNLADSLDPALLRPGRFDKHVVVPLPDVAGRRQILQLHAAKVPLAVDADLEALARGTPGMSGADLSNLINQAALKAALDGALAVDTAALDFAKDKILMGAERRSAVLDEHTLKTTAYHEGGHALVALKSPAADPVHKATIMPRGRALGMVQQLPEGDQTSFSKRQMLARLDVCMGGRVAEQLVFGDDEVTSGASSDIYQATRLAKSMVTKWGFSTSLGVLYAASPGDNDPGGYRISPQTAAAVDAEVKAILDGAYARATTILTNHRDALNAIAAALLDKETLTGEELKAIVAKHSSPANTTDNTKISNTSKRASPKPPRSHLDTPIRHPGRRGLSARDDSIEKRN